jgi:hypothetical protein
MLLAELEVWHSRPLTPTRRVALGALVLPVEPPPGFGGILLAGVVAAHVAGMDPDLIPDLHRLVQEVDAGRRVVQPRLRHRFQVDRHGLARSTHRLVGNGDQIAFEFENHGTHAHQVLGAVYAAERIGAEARHPISAMLHKAIAWRGPIGTAFISHLAGVPGSRATSTRAFLDPTAWALDVLGFPPGTVRPGRKEVQNRFRARLREVHPDHGGEIDAAGQRIGDLAEARRILLG